MFTRFKVQRMYCDPQDWRSEIGEWAVTNGEAHVFEWPTNSYRRMCEALKRFETDTRTGRVKHVKDKLLDIAVMNARRVAKPGQLFTLGKATEQQKIDPAMAMVLAHEAAMDARTKGWDQKTDSRVLVLGRRGR